MRGRLAPGLSGCGPLLLRVGPWLAASFLCAVPGCSQGGRPAHEKVELEGTMVARVGDQEIAGETVASIARAQSVDLNTALDRATFDALAAVEARSRGLEGSRRRELSGALARVLLEDLARESRAQGPPTDREVEELTKAAWFDVARPPAVIVVHALALVPKQGATPADFDRALEVATKIRAVVAPASAQAKASSPPSYLPRRGVPSPPDPSREEFFRLAKTAGTAEVKVHIDDVLAIGDDNLSIRPEGRDGYDPTFVGAAFALKERGDVSEPVRTRFGWHVILLLDRIPGSQLPIETRRKLFEDAVMGFRTRKRIEAALASARAAAPVSEERSADASLGQVRVSP